MGRTATLHFVSLRNCLVNLPLSVTGPLSQRGVAPQSIAVQLTVRGASKAASRTLVAGWTGLPSSLGTVSSHLQQRSQTQLGGDRVEIDPQFAEMYDLGLVEGTQVTIELLRDLQVATSVNVTPLTADDWEILEANAEYVETFLLNQVRAIKVGMTVACWINHSTVVKFLVDSTEPEFPPSTATLPLLLTSATELIVAPKSRHVPPSPASHASKAHDLSTKSAPRPSYQLSPSATCEWNALRKKLLRLAPLSYLAGIHLSEPTSTTVDEVYLSRQTFKTVQAIFGPGQKLTLSVQPRPKFGNHASAPGAVTDDTHEAAVATQSGPKDGTATTQGETVEVRARESARLGAGQVWIGSKLREDLRLMGAGSAGHLLASDGAFELLRLGPPLSIANKDGTRSKTVNDTSGGPRHSLEEGRDPKSSARLNRMMPSTPESGDSPARPAALSSQPVALAGVERQLSSLSSQIVNSFASRQLSATSQADEKNSSAASGILVTGASGAGKTALIEEIGRKMSLDPRAFTRTIYLDCSKYSEERPAALKNRIKDWFDAASWYAPSLLLLDNLDRLIPAEVEHADSFASLHLANTFHRIAQQSLESRPIVIVATAQGAANLHPLLTSTHLLGETISLKGPTKAGRKDILNSLLQAKTSSSPLSIDSKFNAASIAAMTEGYLPADLRDLVDRAIHQSAIRTMTQSMGSAPVLSADDFIQAQLGFVPLSLRDVKLQKSAVQWSDIGGLHETRKTLRETLEWPTKYGAIFASCPLRLRSGLLLYGYPGCGKTLLASAVAKECGLNFISVKGPEILNKYIGASEKSVRDLFDRAQAAKPCVLFFDEFDSIAPKRGHDSTGVTDRVVNQMLTQMDGAEGLDGVYVLAATSRPDLIDPALLRPGRLDKSLLCGMPSYADRLEIMQACSRKLHLSPSISLEEFANQTQGYSGADLQALMYNAHLDAIHAGLNVPGEGDTADARSGRQDEDLKFIEIASGGGRAALSGASGGVRSKATQAVVNKRLEQIMATLKDTRQRSMDPARLDNGSDPVGERQPTVVQPHHLRRSLDTTRPSVPADEMHRLQKIYNEFVSTRSKGGLPSGEASDQVGGRASLM
ncbi:hypothetical protein JCM11491_000758 [Sporobolomyces phaffii]